MKTYLPYKNRFFILFVLFITNITIAQVGIGTTNPDPSSILDVTDATGSKGVLLPRIDITDLSTQAPVTGTISDWLLAFNTNTSVGSGYYYWDGSQWVTIGHNKFWSLKGNAGTSTSTNFIGTTDYTGLHFKTNNTDRFIIGADGNIGIGCSPYTDTSFRVNLAGQEYGIISETNSIAGASILALESGGGDAISGINSGNGLGVYGFAENTHGVYGDTSYTGGNYLTAGVIGWGAGNSNANGMIAITDNTTNSDANIGLRALSGSTVSIFSSTAKNVGINANATDLGLNVLTEKTSGTRESARFQTNYSGNAYNADSRDTRAQLAGYISYISTPLGYGSMYYGAYLYSGGSNNGAFTYAGARFNNINYKVIGNGIVSTIVNGVDETDTKKIMFASEAPEVLFEDYGIGKLTAGTTFITIDPILKKNILVDKKHPLKVFIQLEGDCNGVYVTDKSATGFTVKELAGGTSNTSFSWHIVANRADEIQATEEDSSRYSNLRFPDAPTKIAEETSKIKEVQKHEVKQSFE